MGKIKRKKMEKAKIPMECVFAFSSLPRSQKGETGHFATFFM
jgi:hypothetical protein